MNSLVKNSFFNSIYKVISLIFPLLTSIYVSRILHPSGVGIVSYAQTIASYFVLFATSGIQTYCIREIAKVKNDYVEKNRIFSELLLINVILSIIASILYYIIIFGIKGFQEYNFLHIVCGVQIIAGVINVDWLYQGEENYTYIVIRNLVVKTIALILTVVFVKTEKDFVIYAFITNFALVGNYIFNIIHARNFVKFSLKNLNLMQHLRPILIFIMSTFLGSIYNRIDVVMIGNLSGVISVGLYNNAHKIIDIAISICVAMTTVFLPRLSSTFKHNKCEFDRVLELGFQILCCIAIPASVGIFFLANDVILLMYGPEFLGAAVTIQIFAIIIVIRSFGDLFCYQLLVAAGFESYRIPANFCAAILNIFLNMKLIPLFYQNGAAMASVLSEFAVNGIIFVCMYKRVKFSLPIKSFLISIFSSALLGCFLSIFLSYNFSIVIRLFISVILGIFIFFISNYLLKEPLTEKAVLFIMKIHKN